MKRMLFLLVVAAIMAAVMAFGGTGFASEATQGCRGVTTAVEQGADPPADPEEPPVFSPAFDCFE
jgi:hypothetical protein